MISCGNPSREHLKKEGISRFLDNASRFSILFETRVSTAISKFKAKLQYAKDTFLLKNFCVSVSGDLATSKLR